jgi:mRNA-degrading endonuclease RelE of RelBE toxin-antitoxin system
MLVGLVPPWDHLEPVWALRIGAYRVYYDVDEARSAVIVRAIRHKPSHQTTEDIL